MQGSTIFDSYEEMCGSYEEMCGEEVIMGRDVTVSTGISKVFKGTLVAGLVIVMVAFSYGRVMASSYFGSLITEGLKVDGQLLGSLNQQEALELLADKKRAYAGKKIRLSYDNQQFSYTYEELGVTVNLEQTVQKALQFGRRGGLQQRYREISLARGNKVDIPLKFDIDQKKMDAKITELASLVDVAPQNAAFFLSDLGDVKIKEGVNGRRLEKELLKERLLSLDWNQTQIIPLETKVILPQQSAQDLKSLAPTELLSTATTSFNPADNKRKENLRVAASMLNNKFFAPGEVISFNKVVGPRVVERGFKEANVIVKGKFVPGVGGGVCQVSSTLYNAALKANLDIITRSPHSLKVGYLPAGLDAMVSGDMVDFKFKNNTAGYILLKAEVSGSKITISIYGHPQQAKYSVKLVSKVLKEIPPKVVTIPDKTMFEGQEKVIQKGQPGYRSKAYREVWVKGNLVSKELLSTDQYASQDSIVHVGIKPLQ